MEELYNDIERILDHYKNKKEAHAQVNYIHLTGETDVWTINWRWAEKLKELYYDNRYNTEDDTYKFMTDILECGIRNHKKELREKGLFRMKG